MKLVFATIASAAIISIAPLSAEAGMSGFGVKGGAINAQNDLVQNVRGRRHRGRGVGTGVAIGLGVLGAIAAGSAAAERRDYDDDDDRYEHRRRCRRWFRHCEDGSERACWRYENRC